MNSRTLRAALQVLADRVPTYSRRLRDAGFECCHVNDDWIEVHCNADEVSTHHRYLIEYAGEVLVSDDPFAILPRDELNCRSGWLNDLKALRLSRHGPADSLSKNRDTRHFVELSPGWREFMRVRESTAPADRMHFATQVATFTHRQAEEVKTHSEAIAQCIGRLPASSDELGLQAFFAEHLKKSLEPFGSREVPILQRNQALRRDEKVVAVVFDITDDNLLVLLPTVVKSLGTMTLRGTLSIGFRLMTPTALAAPEFEFGRDVVVLLNELLPNKFNGYGRFEQPEEFCLNILAWTTAVRILLPDVLQTLHAAA